MSGDQCAVEPITANWPTCDRTPGDVRRSGTGLTIQACDQLARPVRRIGGVTVVIVRYFAAARAAAGLPSENVDVDVGDGATVADALDVLAARHGEALRRVLAACSVLLDSVAVRDRTTPLRPGAELDILPPFAGG